LSTLLKACVEDAGATVTCNAKLEAHLDQAFSTLLQQPSSIAQGLDPLPKYESPFFCHAMGYSIVTFL